MHHLLPILIAAIALALTAACSDGCSTPTDDSLPGVERLHFGTYHVCTIDDRQSVWCTGKNDHGQLGDGTTHTRSDLVQVVDLGKISGLAVGFFDVTCAWNEPGEVFCWGNNKEGVLANDDLDQSERPLTIDVPAVAEVTVGAYHACALTLDQQVYCWGSNTRGQLGLGTGVGPTVTEPTAVPDLTGVRAVRAGAIHTCAITDEGALYCWGNNENQQLGLGTGVPGTTTPTLVDLPGPAADLAVSFRHSCALVGERRELYCWGDNSYGQLGLDDLEPRPTPTPVVEMAYVDELATATGQVCARIDSQVFCAGEILRPIEEARQAGEPFIFELSTALRGTTELWSGVLAICGKATDHAVSCRGVQHQALAGDIF